MATNSAVISSETVYEYIRQARPFARSAASRMALDYSSQIIEPKPTAVILPLRRGVRSDNKSGIRVLNKVLTWRHVIYSQIHLALCKPRSRYRKYVDQLKHNIDLLIAAIAAFVGARLKVEAAVIAAMVAASLKLICEMGIEVFCKEFKKTSKRIPKSAR
jgi:hypothetical protein